MFLFCCEERTGETDAYEDCGLSLTHFQPYLLSPSNPSVNLVGDSGESDGAPPNNAPTFRSKHAYLIPQTRAFCHAGLRASFAHRRAALRQGKHLYIPAVTPSRWEGWRGTICLMSSSREYLEHVVCMQTMRIFSAGPTPSPVPSPLHTTRAARTTQPKIDSQPSTEKEQVHSCQTPGLHFTRVSCTAVTSNRIPFHCTEIPAHSCMFSGPLIY